jgi:type IV secretion system protein VirD4
VSAIDQLTATPGGIKTVMMLDEFAMLGHLSAVETAFSMAAGYNLQIWPFIQNLNQLRDVYGETRYLDLISGCGVIQCFSPNDEFTAEYISKRIGDYTQFVDTQSTNISEGESDSHGFSHGTGGHNKNVQTGGGSSFNRTTSSSRTKVGMRLAPWQNVTAMPKDVAYIFLNGLKYPILVTRWPYWTLPGMKDDASPDPFHS